MDCTADPLALFHPVVASWFRSRFTAPTQAQALSWPAIAAGRHTLLAAPTGSGKTLSAFLVCIDRLLRQGLANRLEDRVEVVYVSPLKALSNDIHRNLLTPLAELRAAAASTGQAFPEIRAAVRTGDTTSSERQAMLRRPPHILVTTPESLYLLLTSERGRAALAHTKTVIVDEIHSLARDKRGSHLTLTLERLAALCRATAANEQMRHLPLLNGAANHAPAYSGDLQRIGISATQRPMDEMARFLVGASEVDAAGNPNCEILDVGHLRQLDLAVDVPESPLSAVCSHEQWEEIYQRLADQIAAHRSTLVFVNTRRMAERISLRLRERLGDDAVASHHGSLSKATRLAAEQRLQQGELRAIVATASLELGIDVGYIDLVCQIASPRSISTFLQRIGRAGHHLAAIPKGRLFPLTRDDLVECLALIRAVKEGRLDRVEMPVAPVDILAQQIVAATAVEEWEEEPLYELCRRAWPYHRLTRKEFDEVLDMLATGVGRGMPRGRYVHRDRINGRLRARRGARIAAATNGGAIPETALYRVVVADEGTVVGTIDEHFAVDSSAGDVFQLGDTSWQILHVRQGDVVVRDAQGAPATIPFWFGEAPGRTWELSHEVSSLREEVAARVRTPHEARAWLMQTCDAPESAAAQTAEYIEAQLNAVGVVPTCRQVVFERFFDQSGGMQLVIHAPFGARVNKAWGLSMRKRFCRSFNFELQAAADDNGIVLSLGPQHSFPIEQLFGMLNEHNARDLLIQAMLAVPVFGIRWRWNANRALLVLRQQGGKRVPPHLQRMRAEDLLSAVFPMSTACLENVVGDIELPDHPLVRQTVDDCLQEAMDLERFLGILRDVAAGRVEFIPRDTREPSPFSYELLNANPYAFLDDAGLEERRARAVATRHSYTAADFDDLASLDPAAVAAVVAEAWPTVRDADELHDTLHGLILLREDEAEESWRPYFASLCAAGRACRVILPASTDGINQDETADKRAQQSTVYWTASERWPTVAAVLPDALPEPAPVLPANMTAAPDAIEARQAILRGRLEIAGPVTAEQLAERLNQRPSAVLAALEAIEAEGTILRGNFVARPLTPPGEGQQTDTSPQFCDRRLLTRMQRLTVAKARQAVQPVSGQVYLRFLTHWQHLAAGTRLQGRQGLLEVISQLEGFEAGCGAWERDLLPGRVSDYEPTWLDELALTGEVSWARLLPPKSAAQVAASPEASGNGNGHLPLEPAASSDASFANGRAAITRMVPLSLFARRDLPWLLPASRPTIEPQKLRPSTAKLWQVLQTRGALFFDELVQQSGLLVAEVEQALGELAALGVVASDSFAAVRWQITPNLRQAARAEARRWGHGRQSAYSRGGRWSLLPAAAVPTHPDAPSRAEQWANLLLNRYGLIFRDLLTRETLAPSWREITQVCRRWELQGKVRGGRFVRGVGGEQYARPEAVQLLRQLRDTEPTGEVVVVSGADPLNLVGIVVPGDRVPASPKNALALCDGHYVAALVGGEVRWNEADEDAAAILAQATLDRAAIEQRLRTGAAAAKLAEPAAPPCAASTAAANQGGNGFHGNGSQGGGFNGSASPHFWPTNGQTLNSAAEPQPRGRRRRPRQTRLRLDFD